MAPEAAVFQQDPFIYGFKDYYRALGLSPFQEGKPIITEKLVGEQAGANGYWDSPPSSLVQNACSSSENCAGGTAAWEGFPSGGVAPISSGGRRKKRRTKIVKNKEDMENQRITHIAVERNRRRQMNDYLAILRALMPPSYSQRGDQASIVGGAINFVKELEQLLQFLEAHKPANQRLPSATRSSLFSNFFTFPQYSTCPSNSSATMVDVAAERRSDIADIEVVMVESHANIKVLTRRRPKQLLKMVVRFQSISLTILHLNITTVDLSMLYSFSVKVEDECQLTTVNEIATTVHGIVGMIQEETAHQKAPGDSSCPI